MINFCIVIARGKVMKASQNNHKQNLAQPLQQTKQTEVLANANSCPNNANSTKGEQSLQNSSLQMSESVVQNAVNDEKNEKILENNLKKQQKKAHKYSKKIKMVPEQAPKSIHNKRVRKEAVKIQSAQKEASSVTLMQKNPSAAKATTKRITSLISTMFTVVFAVLTGLFLGDFYLNLTRETNYNFNEVELRDNVENAAARVEQLGILNASAIDVFITAENNLQLIEKYQIFGTGNVKNNFSPQSIYKYCYKYNDTFYAENISYGSIKKIAQAVKYTPLSSLEAVGSVQCVQGTNIQTNSAVWNGAKTEYSYVTYKEFNGVAADSFIPYIVSSKTVLPQSNIQMTDNQDGTYTGTLKLTIDSSVCLYVKQMKTLSGLSKYPNFKKITITFTVDEQCRFISLVSNESYDTNVGFMVPCEGDLTLTFDYDSAFDEKLI